MKQNVNEIVFSAITRALDIMENFATGPLFKRVSQSEHMFDLNVVREDLLSFLERNVEDSSFLMAEFIIFPDSLLTKDEVYEKLFQNTENLFLDVLTQECLEGHVH